MNDEPGGIGDDSSARGVLTPAVRPRGQPPWLVLLIEAHICVGVVLALATGEFALGLGGMFLLLILVMGARERLASCASDSRVSK